MADSIRIAWILVIAIFYISVHAAGVLADASQDDRITTLQIHLNSLGYNAGTPDGVVGPRTEAAIRAFQRDIGSVVDGMVTDQLVGAIYAAWLLQLKTQLEEYKRGRGNTPLDALEPDSNRGE